MPIKITKTTDPVMVETIVTLITGQPGSGKTSTAFTADRTLLLDFDLSSHRSAFRKDMVAVTSWDDIAELSKEDLAPYKTLAIDTAGRCLEAIARDIVAGNPKLGNAFGGLSLQGYGALKGAFASWLSRIRSFGLDVVLLAHDKEDKRGEETVVRSDIQGGSYNEVLRIADQIGFLELIGDKKRVLHFEGSGKFFSKDPAGLGRVEVPDFSKSPEFLAEVIAQAKHRLNTMSEASRVVVERVEELRIGIDMAEGVDQINAMRDQIRAEESEAVKTQAGALLVARAKRQGFRYDKKAGAFVGQGTTAEPEDSTEEKTEKGQRALA